MSEVRKRARKSKLEVRDYIDLDDDEENETILQLSDDEDNLDNGSSENKQNDPSSSMSILRKILPQSLIPSPPKKSLDHTYALPNSSKPTPSSSSSSLQLSVKVEVEVTECDDEEVLLNGRPKNCQINSFEVDLPSMYKIADNLSVTSTNYADKFLSIEIKNVWGRSFRPEDYYEPFNELIQNALHSWAGPITFKSLRESPLFYQCHICNIAWWNLTPFSEHIRIHDITNLKIQFLENGFDSFITANYNVSYIPTYIQCPGDCYRCGNPYTYHVKAHKQMYQCVRCKETLQNCTLMLHHQSACVPSVRNTKFKCPVCPADFFFEDNYGKHMVTAHLVRSDVPSPFSFKYCSHCEKKYFCFYTHYCKRNALATRCKFCYRKFTNKILCDMHVKMNEQNYECKICNIMLDQSCMETQHMLTHTDKYRLVYKCVNPDCSPTLLFKDELSIKTHRVMIHKQKFDKRRTYYEKVLVPEECVEDSVTVTDAEERIRQKTDKKTILVSDTEEGSNSSQDWSVPKEIIQRPTVHDDDAVAIIKQEYPDLQYEEIDSQPDDFDSPEDSEMDYAEMLSKVFKMTSASKPDKPKRRANLLKKQTKATQLQNQATNQPTTITIQPSTTSEQQMNPVCQIQIKEPRSLLQKHLPIKEVKILPRPPGTEVQNQNKSINRSLLISRNTSTERSQITHLKPFRVSNNFLIIPQIPLTPDQNQSTSLQDKPSPSQHQLAPNEKRVTSKNQVKTSIIQDTAYKYPAIRPKIKLQDKVPQCQNKNETETIIVKNQLKVVQNQFLVTQNHMTLPRNKLTVPVNQSSVTKNQLTVSQNQLTNPPNQLITPQNQLIVAETQLSVTQNQLTVLQNQLTVPQNQLTATQNQLEAWQNQPETQIQIKSEPMDIDIDFERLIDIQNDPIIIKQEPIDTYEATTCQNDSQRNDICQSSTQSDPCQSENDTEQKCVELKTEPVANDDDEDVNNVDEDVNNVDEDVNNVDEDVNNVDEGASNNNDVNTEFHATNLLAVKLEPEDIQKELFEGTVMNVLNTESATCKKKIQRCKLRRKIHEIVNIKGQVKKVTRVAEQEYIYNMKSKAQSSKNTRKPYNIRDIDGKKKVKRKIATLKYNENMKRLYTCAKCGYTQTHKLFSIHKKTNCTSIKGIDRYNCSKCDTFFMSIELYLKHFCKHGYNDFECPSCEMQFLCNKDLVSHFTRHMKTSYVNVWKINKQKIPTGKQFMCQKCRKVIPKGQYFSHFEHHMQLRGEMDSRSVPETSLKPVATSIDGRSEMGKSKQLSAPLLLAALQQVRSLDREKNCLVCKRMFERRNDVKRHVIEHLLMDAYTKREKTTHATIKCQMCAETFEKAEQYKFHMREHAALPVYRCELCDKAFSDSSNFAKHKKIHNMRVLICDICQKKFHTKSSLEKHIILHMTTQPVKCEFCEREFFTQSNYNKHLRSAHSKISFRCVVCSLSFATLRLKWDHDWEVHKIRKDEADCPICHEQFRKHIDVKHHVKAVHGKDILRRMKSGPIQRFKKSARKPISVPSISQLPNEDKDNGNETLLVQEFI